MEHLGKTLRDRVSGFSGIATCCGQLINGNVQYTLTSDHLQADKPVHETLDVHQLEIVPDGRTIEIVPPNPDHLGIELGAKVEDVFSGFVGYAARRYIFANGCVYYELIGDHNPKVQEQPRPFLPWNQLKVLPRSRNPVAKSKKDGTGGPAFPPPRNY